MDLLERFFWSTTKKSFYARLTLTRFTILYFSFALLSCMTLVVLHGITLADNHAAVKDLLGIVSGSDVAKDGLLVFSGGKLTLCAGVPGRAKTPCQDLFGWDVLDTFSGNTTNLLDTQVGNNEPQTPAHPPMVHSIRASILSDNCIYSLRWLVDTLKDSIREDVVTLCFQIWLLSLALMTLLSESIPHLGAGILGHLLGTCWAAYRIQSTIRLANIYRNLIVPGACSGHDLLGKWWEERRSHTLGIIIVNSCVLVALTYLSYKLLKVYASQSFACVGASEETRRIYKIVMLFSVSLQLTAFFSLASTGMWLDKISQSVVRDLIVHRKLHLSAFIVTLVLLIPWSYLGWFCVRRECLRRFGVFCAISLFLITLFTSLFFDPFYRFFFSSWSFFATITITSYVCLLIAAILGIMCRLNFGKGLAHYLRVNEALADVNFTAGTFSNKLHHKYDMELAVPPPYDDREETVHHLVLTKTRGSSVYSSLEGDPIMLSSTPPDVKGLISVPDETANKASRSIVVTRAISVKADPLPPVPAQQSTSTVRTKGSLIRIPDLPARMSSLETLRQAINQFPLPPTVPLPHIRDAPSTLSPTYRRGRNDNPRMPTSGGV